MNTEQAYKAFEEWQRAAGIVLGVHDMRMLRLAFIGGVIAQLKDEQRILLEKIGKV